MPAPTYLFFLGSHAELSAAELWGQLQRQGYQPSLQSLTRQYLLATLNKSLSADFLQRLGGTDRIAEVLATSPHPWNETELWHHLRTLVLAPSTKLTLGMSVYGGVLLATKRVGVALKKLAKEEGHRLRFVLPAGNTKRLNAAQVLFNKLLEAPNVELSLLKHNDTFYVAKTTHVQDIVAYEQRDTARPVRDAKNGLLPPKLAQIMLNLATTPLPGDSARILDPFCGMGTILQEGWLMGHTMHGSDAQESMIAASQKNLAWLAQHTATTAPLPLAELHNATQPFPASFLGAFDAVVTEPYLGQPLQHPLGPEQLESHQAPLLDLYLKTFENLRDVLTAGGSILFAFPAFRRQRHADEFALVPTQFLDAIAKIGYSPKQLVPPELAALASISPRGNLLYSRPDALVGRELTLWQKV